ncbi:MAG: ATP synthase F0 subunit B [Candidatus Lambdaproteobacteria bacterium]|nr:ATP synthase F0 subunit B [Candidatus Lambdaproteobacteria bacterium]
MDFRASKYLVEVFNFDVLHMQLNTSLFILGLVLIVMFLMNRWLFKPVLRTMQNRERLVVELHATSEAQRAEIGRLTQTYEEQLRQAREEVARVRQEARREAQQAVEAVLARARREAAAELAAAVAALGADVREARAQLGRSADLLAERVATRLLSA